MSYSLTAIATREIELDKSLSHLSELFDKYSPAIEVVTLCILLAAIQVLDGLLTAIGVSIYGTAAEGNIVVRALMERWGYVEALIIIKSTALIIICALMYLSLHVEWMSRALRTLIVIYMGAAIFPWTVILYKAFA